jgi:hypothetical protein
MLFLYDSLHAVIQGNATEMLIGRCRKGKGRGYTFIGEADKSVIDYTAVSGGVLRGLG